MTIQGARTELINMLNDKNLPIYYKSVLKKVIETIEIEFKTAYNIEQIKESIHEMLFELSEGNTYLDVERQKVENNIFKIIKRSCEE